VKKASEAPGSPSPCPLSFDPEALDGPRGERERGVGVARGFIPRAAVKAPVARGDSTRRAGAENRCVHPDRRYDGRHKPGTL